MEFLDFSKAIQDLLENHKKNSDLSKQTCILLAELENLTKSDEPNKTLCMTRVTILFEGFYRYLSDNSLKAQLQALRAKRWVHHFGTPTIAFLLSFKEQIDQASRLFDEFSLERELDVFPWNIEFADNLIIDRDNIVIIDPKSISRVEVPAAKEVIGLFTKTHNPFGGFTTAPCDPVSQQFIAHAALSVGGGGMVLEIGAAFGAATLEVLAAGVTIFCNDIDPANLAVVRQRFVRLTDDTSESITGDCNKLVLLPGEFPNELIGLPEGQFDAILISRVLHFFSGSKIEESLVLLSKLLSPIGKIYIVCETPFLKNWRRFIPEFNKRVQNDEEWPGEITEPEKYENSGRANSLPKFVHWITKEVLERSLIKAGFSIEHSAYIDRSGQFPDDLLEDGRESVGAIGMKGVKIDERKSKLV